MLTTKEKFDAPAAPKPKNEEALRRDELRRAGEEVGSVCS